MATSPDPSAARDAAPVFDGDTVSFKTRTIRTGRSSVTVEVKVEAERHSTGDVVPVTNAKLTMVSVNAAGQSIPFDSAPTIGAGS